MPTFCTPMDASRLSSEPGSGFNRSPGTGDVGKEPSAYGDGPWVGAPRNDQRWNGYRREAPSLEERLKAGGDRSPLP